VETQNIPAPPQPEPKPQQPVPLFEAALVIVATFFVFLFVSFASEFALGTAPTLIIGELLILIVPLIYLLMKHINIKSYIRMDLKPKYILIGLGCAVVLLFINILSSVALTYVFGESQAVIDSNKLITGLTASPTGFIAVAVSLGLAGICEEFAFRGFLQNSVFKSLSSGKSQKFAFAVAVVISAGVFGLFHFDPQAVYTISAFISGLALGYIYHKLGYTTSATAHATMNLIVLAFLIFGIG
jgi:membrane protease YdiL (CAAX protease family)